LALKAAGVGAVHIIPGTMFVAPDVRSRTAELLRAHRLPASTNDTAFPRAGGLLSYSPNRTDAASRVAWYVDKILKGAKPADLPMERPSKFDFVINKKTADELSLTIPQEVLAEATEIIQ
jgi:putative ABC transport system substrate-binding protein